MKISLFLLTKIFLIFYINKTYNFASCTESDDLEVVEEALGSSERLEHEPPADLTEEELLDKADDTGVMTSEKLSKDVSKSEKFEYQAEVSRLLDIIVNSLYSTKEIFLRELVSNSADALEKYKITSMQKNYKDKDDLDLFVRIRSYPKKRLLTVWDSGVGMTKSDLMNNLGTIAKSGTANFLDSLSKVAGDSNLIGQFGVGFYSAFLVADTVLVQSKHYEDKQYVWKSSAANSYELYEDTDNSLGEHGTMVTLELREDATDYLKTEVLENLVKKYSQFVRYPIQLYKKLEGQNELGWVSVNETQQIWTRNKATVTEQEYNDFYRSISGKKDNPLAHVHFTAEGDVDFKALLYIPSSPPNMYFENEGVTHNVKLYSRRVLVSEKLRDFIPRYLFSVYGVVDSDSFPLNVSREHLQQSKLVKVIGKKVVRTVLDTLFDVMKKSDEDVKAVKAQLEEVDQVKDEKDWNKYKDNLKNTDLDEFNSFFSRYLMEKKAAPKSKDEPFKLAPDSKPKDEVKEEDKEQDKDKEEEENWNEEFEFRRRQLERKMRDVDKYTRFYKGFKGSLKVGCFDDDQNRKKIARLLRYQTLYSSKEMTFDEYVDKMPEDQTEIYYVTSENYEDMDQMPHLQGLRKRRYDVLYLNDTMDESCLTKLEEYRGKKFKNAQKADLNLKLTDEELREEERKEQKYRPLLLHLKDLFPETSGVKLSRRLVEDPCTVVASEWSMSSHMENLMKSYTVHRDDNFTTFNKLNSKVLELNPDHPIMVKLLYMFTSTKQLLSTAGAEAKDDDVVLINQGKEEELDEARAKYMKRLNKFFKLLYNSAKLKSGFNIEEPQLVVNYLYERLNKSLGDFLDRDYEVGRDLTLNDFEVKNVKLEAPEHIKKLQEQQEMMKKMREEHEEKERLKEQFKESKAKSEASDSTQAESSTDEEKLHHKDKEHSLDDKENDVEGVTLNLDELSDLPDVDASKEDLDHDSELDKDKVKDKKKGKKGKKRKKKSAQEEEQERINRTVETLQSLYDGGTLEGFDVTTGTVDSLDGENVMKETLKSRGMDPDKLRSSEEDYQWSSDEL